jgi:predicted PurR-regulated permease PerM
VARRAGDLGSSRRHVSPSDVWTVLWVALLFFVALYLLYELRRVLVWLLVAIFAAAVVSPLVAVLVRRGFRRGVAVAVVVVALLIVMGLLVFAFVQPLVTQSEEFARNLPDITERVREAPIVRGILDRFNIQSRLDEASADLPRRLVGLSGPLLQAFKTLGEVTVAAITIFVMMIFLLLYGPGFVQAGLARIGDSARRREVEEVSNDILSAVSGWVAGNVLTSIIAGVVSVIVFLVIGLPYAVLLGLWVAIADLIPLVGATLGAVPAIIVAFIHSLPAGIIVTAYFIAYQQVENHVLQPFVYGRTIQLNPFVVLLSVIVGVELAGFLGALFALPVAGSIQVIINHSIGQHREPQEAPLPVEPEDDDASTTRR